jgi:NADPH-dependent 2,4-dienoyl-CoA reductase/sulfur reductase-like enzyme
VRSIDVAIVGAGPYGLSLANGLRARQIEFGIFGEPMGAWTANMPPGMFLKSYPWASNLYAPQTGFTTREFCAKRAIPYHDRMVPLSRETFVAYGQEYQLRLVPNVERKMMRVLTRSGRGYRMEFEDGEEVEARRVVLAIGVQPFRRMPKALANLPAELCSHSGSFGRLDGLFGKKVVIIGAGASATDLAALLQQAGAFVSLVARVDKLAFAALPRHRRLLEKLVGPSSGIGEGWVLKACAEAPHLIHLLPESWRHRLANSRALGPLGGAFIPNRVIGKVRSHLGREVNRAEARGDQVIMHLSGRDGASEVVKADHVIAATGYKIDLGQLHFLDSKVREGIRCAAGTPVLSANYESSLPGLHFVGPASANSFGPVARFVFGTRHPARWLPRHFSRRRGSQLAVRSKFTMLRPVVPE